MTRARPSAFRRPLAPRPLARLIATLAATTALLGASPAWAEFRLNILHLNDPHSRIEPINRFDSTCSAEDDEAGDCFGGFARLKTAIDERKAALPGATIVVSAGDHFQGSLFYTTYKGAGEAEMAEAIGVELMTLGNHEFDDGDVELGAFLDGVSFPVLGANVDASRSGAVGDRIDSYVIVEFDDAEGATQRVGFVGVVASDTAETSSPGPNIDIGDDLIALREAVAALETRGIDKFIAVTHVGLARDRELALAVPQIDLIIGGHSHTLLSNEPDGSEEGAEPYPVVVDDTPIVQAYAYGKYLGEMVLRFDDEGALQSLAGDPVLIDASFDKDEALDARITEMLGPIEELKAMVVGETTGAIDGDRTSCRAGECQMGNLVADAMLDRVADQGIDIAIQNGGGLRASIDAGTITMGEVLTVLPFQNTLATFELTGADIVTSLENGVSEIEEGAGRFPQVAGMSFAFDPAAEPGSRVSDVMVGGEPIDPDATYGVVSNNFMRGGGDGYELFASNGTNAYDFGPGLERVVADYIATGPVTPALDGRIVDLSSAASDPETAEAADESVPADDGSTAADATGPMAIEAINRAVETTGGTDDLASPPVIAADGEIAVGTEADAAAATGVADAEAPTTGTETDAAAATGVADAEPMVDVETADAAETINEAVEAVTDDASLADAPTIETDAADVTAEIVEATPAPAADAEAVQELIDKVADEIAAEVAAAEAATADAAETINEAVEAVTDDAPLAEAPTIETDAEPMADMETADAAETINEAVEAVTDDAPLADAPTIETDAAAVTAEIVEATPAPTADVEAVQELIDKVAEEIAAEVAAAEAATADAAETINEAVEAVTDDASLADAPTIETDATDVTAEIVEATPAPTADVEAVQETIEEVAEKSAAEVAADEAATAAVAETINEAVEAVTDDALLADAPTIESDAAAVTAEIVEATPAPTVDVEAVQETVEEVAEQSAAEAVADEAAAAAAAETINEAVEAVTDDASLADAPTIEVDAANAGATAPDETMADETVAVDETDFVEVDVADGTDITEGTDAVLTETDVADGDAAATDAATDAAADGDATPSDAVTADSATDAPVEADASGEVAPAGDGMSAGASVDDATDEPTTDEATTDEAVADDGATETVEAADAEGSDPASDTVAADDAADTTDAQADGDAADADAVQAADAVETEPRTYTVRDGDTFWSIAGELYGDPTLFTLLVEANEENARRLQIGDEIVVPERPE